MSAASCASVRFTAPRSHRSSRAVDAAAAPPLFSFRPTLALSSLTFASSSWMRSSFLARSDLATRAASFFAASASATSASAASLCPLRKATISPCSSSILSFSVRALTSFRPFEASRSFTRCSSASWPAVFSSARAFTAAFCARTSLTDSTRLASSFVRLLALDSAVSARSRSASFSLTCAPSAPRKSSITPALRRFSVRSASSSLCPRLPLARTALSLSFFA